MTKEEAKIEIEKSNLKLGDWYKRNSDGAEFKIHDITPQTNINDFNSYHVQVGLVGKSNKSTSEKLSSFHSLFTKI